MKHIRNSLVIILLIAVGIVLTKCTSNDTTVHRLVLH